MAVGFLPVKRVVVPASGGWREDFNFWTGPLSAKVASPIDGFSVVASLTLANQSPPAAPIDLSGYFTVAGNTATIAVPRTVTQGWPLGDYDFDMRVIDPDADEDVYVLYSDPATSRVRVAP